MIDFVRTHADADNQDAPDSSLTVYGRMAYNDILSRRGDWPHLEARYTLTTVGGTSTYLFTSLSSTDLERVTAIVDSGNSRQRLVYLTPEDADVYFPPTGAQGTPTAYTIRGSNTIELFPTPNAAGSYTVRGFRNETSWPNGAGSSPDLPRVYDEAICWFMLAQYFIAQEDPQLSQMYLTEYETQVSRYLGSQKAKRPRPNVVGGNNRTFGPRFIDRVRSYLEQ